MAGPCRADKLWDFEMQGEIGIVTMYGKEHIVRSKRAASQLMHRIPLSTLHELKPGEVDQWVAASKKLFDSKLPD